MNGLMMDYQLTIDKIIEHANRLYPSKKVVTKLPDGAFHEYTYADMYRRVKRLAKALTQLGVEPGDRVGTFAWNNYQHMELYYGIPGAGAVCHTLNIRLFPDQLEYVVNHAADKVIFIDASLLPLVQRVQDKIVDTVQHFVLMNGSAETPTTLPNVIQYEDLLASADDDFEWRSTDENMAMGLCYTSGTTGNPKGALYSHRSMYMHTLAQGQANAMAICETDVVLPVVPQFHAMAWGLPYAVAMAGANIIMPNQHLQGPPLAEMLEKYRVTIAAGVPTIWTALYHELKANPRDISTIRSLVVGGSAMPRALTKAYESELGVNVLHAWGMTEMSPLGTVCNLMSHHEALDQEAKWDVKAVQGYPVFGVEIRVIDFEGNEVAWDGVQIGELQVRGAWVSKAYFGLDVSEDHFTADGWFRTGDVVTMLPDGYMKITDRTKDLIKSGGEWISTVDLENEIMAHANVIEAAVVAIPDDRWAERPMAVVVPAPNTDGVTQADVMAHLNGKFAKFWMPDKVVIVEALPKTSTGKFDKKVLRAQYAEGTLGA
ncbi:MAG: long-chain fatty acid--CoA ligase [Candidatus Promineifilaceae bacterium]